MGQIFKTFYTQALITKTWTNLVKLLKTYLQAEKWYKESAG
jgi:hypothetical protein